MSERMTSWKHRLALMTACMEGPEHKSRSNFPWCRPAWQDMQSLKSSLQYAFGKSTQTHGVYQDTWTHFVVKPSKDSAQIESACSMRVRKMTIFLSGNLPLNLLPMVVNSKVTVLGAALGVFEYWRRLPVIFSLVDLHLVWLYHEPTLLQLSEIQMKSVTVLLWTYL